VDQHGSDLLYITPSDLLPVTVCRALVAMYQGNRSSLMLMSPLGAAGASCTGHERNHRRNTVWNRNIPCALLRKAGPLTRSNEASHIVLMGQGCVCDSLDRGPGVVLTSGRDREFKEGSRKDSLVCS
jgi:hypothetical protein